MDQQFQVIFRLMFFKNVLSTNQILIRVVIVKTSDWKTIAEVYYPIVAQLGYSSKGTYLNIYEQFLSK